MAKPRIKSSSPAPGPGSAPSPNDWIVGLAMQLRPGQHFLVPMDGKRVGDKAYVQRRIDNLSSLLRRRVRKLRPLVKIVVRRSGASDLAVRCFGRVT